MTLDQVAETGEGIRQFPPAALNYLSTLYGGQSVPPKNDREKINLLKSLGAMGIGSDIENEELERRNHEFYHLTSAGII